MGAYLSEPLTDKDSLDEENERLACAASSMQGWRIKQEDAHNVILDFDTNASMFAVYDGHGGAEVAKYCALKLPRFIKYTKGYKEGDYSRALESAFLDIDETMTHPYVVQTLKTLSDEGSEAVTDDGSEEEENVHNLYEESRMPLEELIAKYRSEVNSYMTHFKKNEGGSSSSSGGSGSGSGGSTSASASGSGSSSSKPMSPFLRSKRSGAINDGAGSSSSSKCNEIDFVESQVSSSTSSSGSCSKASNSESEVSTTNGDHSLPESPSISSTNDAECSKPLPNDSDKPEIPQSNSSISDSSTKFDPDCSKETGTSNNIDSEKSKNNMDGSDGDGNSLEDAESKPEQSNSSNNTKKRSAGYYDNFLGMITADDDDYESDSNDENFEGKEEGSSSEDDNTTNGVNGDSSEEEDSSDDDDDDEIHDFAMKIKNEPGSNSGCTAVVALLHGTELYVANAGDSRCVVCRNGEAVDMSIDHKPEDDIELERIIKAGGKVSKDGRVNGGLNLSRAIGDLGYKQNKSLGVKEQMITAFPDVKTLTINPETDKFMVLACDGIWNFMSSKNVVNFVSERLAEGRKKLSQICEEMFDHCLAPNTTGDGTGCDNMTAVIVVFKPSLKDVSIEIAAKKRTCQEMADEAETNSKEVEVKRSKTDCEEAGSVSSSV